MKRILTILTVVLLACTTLFAVDFTGSFTTGLGFQMGTNEDWSLWLMGDDGEGTRESTLPLAMPMETAIGT